MQTPVRSTSTSFRPAGVLPAAPKLIVTHPQGTSAGEQRVASGQESAPQTDPQHAQKFRALQGSSSSSSRGLLTGRQLIVPPTQVTSAREQRVASGEVLPPYKDPQIAVESQGRRPLARVSGSLTAAASISALTGHDTALVGNSSAEELQAASGRHLLATNDVVTEDYIKRGSTVYAYEVTVTTDNSLLGTDGVVVLRDDQDVMIQVGGGCWALQPYCLHGLLKLCRCCQQNTVFGFASAAYCFKRLQQSLEWSRCVRTASAFILPVHSNLCKAARRCPASVRALPCT